MSTFIGRLHDSASTNVIGTKLDCNLNSIDLTLIDPKGLGMLDLKLELKNRIVWLTVQGLGATGNTILHCPISRMPPG